MLAASTEVGRTIRTHQYVHAEVNGNRNPLLSRGVRKGFAVGKRRGLTTLVRPLS